MDIARIACVAKVSDPSNLKILTPKKVLQRLTIALAQVKAGNISQKLLNEIRQIIYFLYWAKKLLKKYMIYKEFNKVIKQNGYYFYEFWE